MKHRLRILEVTSYPPPRAGWGIRVEYVKHRLALEGHECAVLNIGSSRRIPSVEYETVHNGWDFVRKVWRYSRRGYTVHAHANGDSPTGVVLAIVALAINAVARQQGVLTFHAGAIQRHFPRERSGWMVPLFALLFRLPRTIICNSESVRRCITGYGVEAEKIRPIPAFSRQYLEFTPVALPSTVERFLTGYRRIVFTYVRMRVLFYPVTMIEGMAEVLRRQPDLGLIVCGGTGHSDQGVWPAVQRAIRRHGIEERVCFIDDLDHDAFLTVLQRSTLYLRTPITDGVASSVLESLALGVPVVACENGTRPPGVVTYPAEDASSLAAAVEDVICRRDAVVASLAMPEARDTVADEIAVLAC